MSDRPEPSTRSRVIGPPLKDFVVAHIMTVRGAVAPETVGSVMTHEHVFIDVSNFWEPGAFPEQYEGTEAFTAEMSALARWHSTGFRDNMVLRFDDDYDLVRSELAEFFTFAGGGGCVVELTTRGVGPQPAALRVLAEDLDAHIVAGAGWYVHAAHPRWVDEASVDQLERALLSDVREGFADTGARPGIIGEIGTSERLQPCEERVLRASARVAQATGLAINVHCEPPEAAVLHQILDVLAAEGHDLTRTYLSHLDEIWDTDYHASVLDRGVVVGFDSFGQDGYFSPSWKSLSDLTKLRTACKLIDRGYGDRLVLSQDVSRKHHLHRFGGFGYDHVVRRVVPRMKDLFDIDDRMVESMLVDNPRRLLTVLG